MDYYLFNWCESLLDSYKADAGPNKHIFECIRKKLTSKIEVMVGNRVEINNTLKQLSYKTWIA